MLPRLSARCPARSLARGYATHLRGRANVLAKRPDDVVITFAKRTALGRAKKGQLKDVPVDELLHALFKVGVGCVQSLFLWDLLFCQATFEKTKLNPALLEDVCVGESIRQHLPRSLDTHCPPGTCHPPSPLYVSRAAAIASGVPAEVPISTVNRLCSSGLQSIVHIANSIRGGQIEVGMAVGVESMSLK